MKRVFNQALSLISPTRRDKASPGAPAAKRPRAQSSVGTADVYAHLDAIERVQSRLLTIDKECSREQMEVQRRFDAEKLPLIQVRKNEIARIPYFWMTAIGNHPSTDQGAFTKDKEILAYLETIELDDNIDDNGSYTLTFKFDSGNPYFSESELVRKVAISDDQTDEIECTNISWAPRKKPVHSKSFFAWFSSSSNNGNWELDFGEVIRRDLWQNPYPYYLNVSPHSGREGDFSS